MRTKKKPRLVEKFFFKESPATRTPFARKKVGVHWHRACCEQQNAAIGLVGMSPKQPRCEREGLKRSGRNIPVTVASRRPGVRKCGLSSIVERQNGFGLRE